MIHSWVTLTPLNLGALILQLPSLKSEPLQGLDGPPIFFDDDLMKMQIHHRIQHMPWIIQEQQEGNKAV